MKPLKKAYLCTLIILLVFSLIKCAGNGNDRLDEIKRMEREGRGVC